MTVERADLAAWVSDRLAEPRPGQATVVYHTIVWPYLPDAVRDAAEVTLAVAGERAGDEAPLALLAFEGSEDDPSRIELHLTEWPGGERRLLARTSHHPVTVSGWPERYAASRRADPGSSARVSSYRSSSAARNCAYRSSPSAAA